jgi:hypothetical protein
MMKTMRILALSYLALGLAACSPYRAKPEMNYSHGETPPAGYVQVVRASATEVEFLIKVVFGADHMYHLLLDGNEPLAEGWFPTNRMAPSQGYHVTLKLHEGLRLEPGKSYRLCIGSQNPEGVQQFESSNYRCLVDYIFVFKAK